jgi:hypothetical protein
MKPASALYGPRRRAYRWKGESVSTAEVLTALTAVRDVAQVVYGVRCRAPTAAGIAALVVDATFDVAAFRARLRGGCGLCAARVPAPAPVIGPPAPSNRKQGHMGGGSSGAHQRQAV